MRPFLPALILLALGSSALAGPKPPASAVFEPEIGYTYASGNYMDLRLANFLGDKAILVHRTAFGALGAFDLSDETAKLIVYQDGGKLFVRSWQNTGGPVTVSGATLIYSGPDLAEIPDFSPDASKIAFSVLSPNRPGIKIYDFNQTEPLSTALEGWRVFTVRWHPSQQALLFVGYQDGTTDPAQIHRLDLATGLVSTVVSGLLSPIQFDVGRPVSSQFFSPAAMAVNSQGSSRVDLHDLGGAYVRPIAEGQLAHFNCKNDAIIHRAFATRRPPTRITFLAGTSYFTWSTDSNIHHTDWIRRVPCV